MGCVLIFIMILIVTVVISYEVIQNKTDYDKRIDDEQQERYIKEREHFLRQRTQRKAQALLG